MPALAYTATAVSPPRGRRPSWTVERVAAEHEARGLLNVLALAARCRRSEAGAPGPKRWERDEAEARAGLERLYAAGLPRDFLLAPPALASEAHRIEGRDRRGTPDTPKGGW